MKKLLLLTLGLLFFLSTQIQAQTVKKDLKSAHKYYKKEYFRQAIPLYEKVLSKDQTNAEAYFKAGVSYLHQHSKEKALEYIEKAIELDPEVDKFVEFWHARALHHNYRFDEALEKYETVKETLAKKDQHKEELDRYIHQTEVGKALYEKPVNYFIQNLGEGVNTNHSEHSPVLSTDDQVLYYTSRKEGGEGKKVAPDGSFFEDIYFSKRNDDGSWGPHEPLHLNTTGHDACIQLIDNNSKMIIYRYTKGGDLYLTTKISDNNWSEPDRLDDLNTSNWEADAYLMPSGKTIYFATDRFSSDGNLDIFYATLNDDSTWSKPQELPGSINSPYDEDAPYMSDDGKTFYFSSRGHDNMGGFDIFKSEYNESSGEWGKPINLGYPINTPDDDVYYHLFGTEDGGVLSSYREGGFGEKDIYAILPVPEIVVKGIVMQEEDKKPLDTLQLYFTSSGERMTTEEANTTSKDGGKYEVTLLANRTYDVSIIDGKDTVYAGEYELPMQMNKNVTSVEKDFLLDYVRVKDTTEVVADSSGPVTTIKASDASAIAKVVIYFNFDKAFVPADYKKDLDKVMQIMKDNKDVSLAIVGHTDNVGPEGYNQTLSVRRAQSVKDFLVSKGVDKNRLKVKGMGEAQPKADNGTPEGRAKNRRAEFKVTE